MANYDKLLQVPRGTKARLETIKLNLLVNTIVYATDTKELGIKLSDGNIEYFMNAKDINARVGTLDTNKQEKLVAGTNITIDENNVISASGGGEVDLDEMVYFDFAGRIYGARNNILLSAWAHSLTVDPLEISADSEFSPPNNRGRAQYPNEVTEGIIIPRGVTTIGKYAFAHAYGNNQPLIIPNSVTHIGHGAFHAWSINNHPLVIPDGVIEIGQHAFNSWQANNQPVTIPNSVTSIGEWAFRDWISAKEFIMESETPPTITRNSFFNTNDAPFYVPNNRVQTYKTATNWVDLADRIYPISDRTSGEGGIPEAPADGNEYVRKNSGWKKNIPVEIDANYNGIQYQDYMFLMSDKKWTESGEYEITKVYGVPVHEVITSIQEHHVEISNFSTPHTGFSPSGDSLTLVFALVFSIILSPLIITMYDESDNYIGDLTIQIVKLDKESGKFFYSGTFFNVIEQSMQPFIVDLNVGSSDQKYMNIYVPLTQTKVEYVTASVQVIPTVWD